MKTAPARRPKGIPVGGQYAPTMHAESDTDLADTEVSTAGAPSPEWRTRRQEIREAKRQVTRLMDLDEKVRDGSLREAWDKRSDELVDEGLVRSVAEAQVAEETGMERPNNYATSSRFNTEAEVLVRQVGNMVHAEALYRTGPPPDAASPEDIADAETDMEAKRQALVAIYATDGATMEDLEAARQAHNAAAKHLRSLKTVDADLTWRKAYGSSALEVLSEIRPFGDNVGHAFHESSKKPAVVAVQTALEGFPSDWVAASSAYAKPLMPKVSKRRAHYSDGAAQTTRREARPPETRTLRSGPGIGSGPEDLDRQIAIWKSEGKIPVWTRGGWRNRKIISVEANDKHDNIVVTYEGGVRQVTERAYGVAELTTDKSPSTTMHETAHRMESANPRVLRLESAFYQRRTSDAEGRQEATVRYRNGGRGERVRPDGFVEEYIGKDYQGTAYEIMSVGMEGVFHGRYGALQGIGHKTADLDYAAFVLGTLASV